MHLYNEITVVSHGGVLLTTWTGWDRLSSRVEPARKKVKKFKKKHEIQKKLLQKHFFGNL